MNPKAEVSVDRSADGVTGLISTCRQGNAVKFSGLMVKTVVFLVFFWSYSSLKHS
jgi:hypothetical protein